MTSVDTIIIENTDHFLMMAHPDKFIQALAKAIRMILKRYE